MGEPPIEVMRYQQQFELFDRSKVGQTIRYLHLAEEAKTGHLEKVLQRICSRSTRPSRRRRRRLVPRPLRRPGRKPGGEVDSETPSRASLFI